jgi:hypothetical protein
LPNSLHTKVNGGTRKHGLEPPIRTFRATCALLRRQHRTGRRWRVFLLDSERNVGPVSSGGLSTSDKKSVDYRRPAG